MVVHGLLAVALMHEAPASVPVRLDMPRTSSARTEMVWFDGVGRPPSAQSHPLGVVAPVAAPAAQAVRTRREPVRQATRAPSTPVAVESPRTVPAAPVPSPSAEAPAEVGPGPAIAETTTQEGAKGTSGVESAAAGSGAEASHGGGLGSRGTTAASNGGAGGNALSDLRAYVRRLYVVVARQQRYPANAVRLGMEGTAQVQLHLRQDGTLMEPPRIVRSSGQEVLDAEALRMVEAAAPFEPMPERAARSDAAFVISVLFSLRSGG